MARISRIGDELKLISLTRSRISAAVRGGSSRSSGLMWTMTMSLLSQHIRGKIAGLPIAAVPIVLPSISTA